MSLFRSGPTRIYYGDNRSAVEFDVIIVATAVAAGMLGLAWLLVLPTAKRMRNTLLINGGYAFAIYVALASICQYDDSTARSAVAIPPCALTFVPFILSVSRACVS